MASLKQAALSRSVALGGSLALVLVLFAPSFAAGGEPASVSETPRLPTCAQRYPAEGPAGVDLRLGCVVSELIGLWRPDQSSAPPTLSAYAITAAALVVASVALGLAITRLLARRAGRRLAPMTPDAWWVCPSCHSINGFAASRCYNCGSPQPSDAAAGAMLTGDPPTTPQSFGRGKPE